MLPLLPGHWTPILLHPGGSLFLKLTISHVNRRLNRNTGPQHGPRGKRAPSPPPASSSWRFHQGNGRSGIRDTMHPIQVSRAARAAAAAAAGRFMTCSKCLLFNSPRWLHHLWTQHGLDCWPSVAGETCRRSPPHTNTPGKGPGQPEAEGAWMPGTPYLQPAMSSSIS